MNLRPLARPPSLSPSFPSSLPSPSLLFPTLLYLYTHAFVVLEGAAEVPQRRAGALAPPQRRPAGGPCTTKQPSLSLSLLHAAAPSLLAPPLLGLMYDCFSLSLSLFLLLRQKEQKGHVGSVGRSVVGRGTRLEGGRGGTERARYVRLSCGSSLLIEVLPLYRQQTVS